MTIGDSQCAPQPGAGDSQASLRPSFGPGASAPYPRLDALEAVLESVPAIVWIARDPHCREITASRASREMFGGTTGVSFLATAPHHNQTTPYRMMRNQEELPAHELPIRKAAINGTPVRDVELDVVFHDGSKRTIFGNAEPLFDEAGTVRGAVAAFLDITELNQTKARLEEFGEALLQRAVEGEQLAAELRALTVALTRAELMERRRLAQAMHDDLQQLLVAAKLQLELARTSGPATAAQKTAQALDLVTEAITTSRDLTFDLSPPIPVELKMASALEWLADWSARRYDLAVEVEVAADAEPTCETMRALLFQIVRELLFNIVKHAKVKRARIVMSRVGLQVRILVVDEGAGFDPAALANRMADGFGLFSVKSRLELLGGNFEIDSAPGKGTRVTLLAPLTQVTSQASGSNHGLHSDEQAKGSPPLRRADMTASGGAVHKHH